MRIAPTVAVIVAAGVATLSAPASAQTVPVLSGFQPGFQFNFSPPGARSVAMGAAFIGLADDATAAESNPAGLTILTRPEVSAHGLYSSFRNTVPNTIGFAGGVPAGGFGTFKSTVGNPSFFSVTYPYENMAFSAYYQRAADYRLGAAFTGNYVSRGFRFSETDDFRTRFQTDNIGASVAYKVSPQLSLGGSLRLTRIKGSTTETLNVAFIDLPNTTVDGRTSADFSASKATFNAGILVTPTPQVSLGAVFKKGASFEIPYSFRVTSRILNQPFQNETRSSVARQTVPDSFGAGVAIRATDRLTLLGDVLRIKYSKLSAVGSYFADAGQGGAETIKDGTEVHGGAEYTMSLKKDLLLAVRGGFYTNPDHDGLGGVDSKQLHGTFGGGVVVSNRYQFDGAVNIGDSVRSGLLSVVIRF